MENRKNTGVKDAEPICDNCPVRKNGTFMCEPRIDQFVKEEAEADRLLSFPRLINQDKYVWNRTIALDAKRTYASQRICGNQLWQDFRPKSISQPEK